MSNPTTPTKTAKEMLTTTYNAGLSGHALGSPAADVDLQKSEAALHQAIADMVERIIGEAVHPFWCLVRKRQNADCSCGESFRVEQARQRAKAELDKFFGEGGSRE